MRIAVLVALLLSGCAVKLEPVPTEKADSSETILRRGVRGESPGVDPVGPSERIDRAYANHDLH